MIPLDASQPIYDVPDPSGIPDANEDRPLPGKELPRLDSGFSPLAFGGAAFSGHYQSEDHIRSSEPFRTLRLALRYGITTIDTSTYYGQSEIVLGSILRALEPEFPRSSYKLMTKCGRFGGNKQNFDYTPSTLRKSVQRSLERLGTTYLDVLYLHDVEFVADPIYPEDPTGDPTRVIDDDTLRAVWGLDENKSRGEGDDKIVAAYSELRDMRSEGLVRAIGITGYPLPTLLRLACLLTQTFSEPLDTLMSYSHHTLSSPTALASYIPLFFSPSRSHFSIPLVRNLFCASPLNMGFFGDRQLPSWTSVSNGMKAIRKEVIKFLEEDEDGKKRWEGGIVDLALGYGFRRGTLSKEIPTVIGLSTLNEVHEAVRVWWEVNEDAFFEHRHVDKFKAARRKELEKEVTSMFERGGWLNWSWASPPLL
ncbi:NADP-dependent oxidoreductase domain-containing protein [Cantharellus anzutake]|uniref:NADP-dependent oxidoreductase domain-containing protein n=1 Tax=Cantharellus anzutake TaxID=1750568 RepID=UPI001903F5CA|nr:NADP-dependent oxidoreductase domain-containing protein [Cantharellus anzutake]KAF8341516.1 NADP-dependent oxidoreductase domain-containing protein [Cantharellus anzutake]